MRPADLALLALLQIPNAALAAAAVFLAYRARTRGAVLVAVSLSATFILSVAGNFLPDDSRVVFDESGEIAGAMVRDTDPYLLLGYVGTGLRLLLAVGLLLLAMDWRTALARSARASP